MRHCQGGNRCDKIRTMGPLGDSTKTVARRCWIAVLVALSAVPLHAQDGVQPWQLGLSVLGILLTTIIASVAVAGLLWRVIRDGLRDSRAESRHEHDQLHGYMRERFEAHDKRFDEIDERDRKRASALVQGLF